MKLPNVRFFAGFTSAAYFEEAGAHENRGTKIQ
jgi:hypothetical protein